MPDKSKRIAKKEGKVVNSTPNTPKDANQNPNAEHQDTAPDWVSLECVGTGKKNGAQVEIVRIREDKANAPKAEANKSGNRDSVENASTMKLGENISDKERKRKAEKNKLAIAEIIKILQGINPSDVSSETKADLIRMQILVRGIHVRNAQWHVAQDQHQVEEMMRKLNSGPSMDTNNLSNQTNPVNVIVVEIEKDDGKQKQGGKPKNPPK